MSPAFSTGATPFGFPSPPCGPTAGPEGLLVVDEPLQPIKTAIDNANATPAHKRCNIDEFSQ
jgi:hypothetical protein